MNDTSKAKVIHAAKHYMYGCLAKSWNGAITAVYAFVGQAVGAGVDPEHFGIPTWRTAAIALKAS